VTRQARAAERPHVSVILPVYNAQQHLGAAIDSVLAQTLSNFELIIIDDGSTDRSAEIVEGYRDRRIVRLAANGHRGFTTAVNRGLTAARGALIARQDADDVSLPRRLEEQVRAMDRRPGLVILGAAYHVVDERGAWTRTIRKPASDAAVRWQLLFDNPFCHTAVMLRADVLRSRGLAYEASFELAEDYELWSRLLEYGEGGNLDDVLVQHRVHIGQLSHVFASEQNTVADRVAHAALVRLGVEAPLADVAALRRWYPFLPHPGTRGDARLHALLLDALSAFERRWHDRALARAVRRRCLRDVLHPRSAQRLGLLASARLVTRIVTRR
jgi:glycosyltransferase involved in cell wall biosynthesis